MATASHGLAIDTVPADIDGRGHVRNDRYLAWVQAAVIAHWRRLAPPDAVDAYVWVALRHEITYRRPAFLHDHVIATPVLRQVGRESAFYDTAICRDRQLLARVASRWCCLNAHTMQPARLPPDIIDRFLGRTSPAAPHPVL